MTMFRNQSWQSDPSMLTALLPRDVQYCKDRAISEALAKKAGIYSVDRAQAARLLNRTSFSSGGLVIPYYPDGNGDHFRLRLDEPLQRGDGKPMRWITPYGQKVRPYIPPFLTQEECKRVKRVIVVEGAPKALSVYEATNTITIGLGGVSTGHDTDALLLGTERLHPELLAMCDWKGVEVIIAFDSNRNTKSMVLAGEKRITRCFQAAGADVKVVELPHDEKGAEWGPDDFIAKHGKEEFKRMLEASRWANEVHQPIKEINLLLRKTAKGETRCSLNNIITILHLDPRWEGVIAADDFSHRMVMRRAAPWDDTCKPKEKAKENSPWTDADDVRLSSWLERHWGISPSPEMCMQAVNIIGKQNPFHPVREYLDAQAWDGNKRCHNWMQVYLGAEEKPYTSAVGIKFLVSMVARVMHPGCKADCLPIFEGRQGLKKSQAMRIICKGWFTDQLSDISNKDAALELQGVWGVELSEADHLLRAEASALKRFFSRQADRFRTPYGRRVEEVPRQCIFMGTTNEDSYLQDATGARRYWPIRLLLIHIDLLERDIDQLWAEAVMLYKQGEKWWLDDAMAKVANEEQDMRYIPDAWEERIDEYLHENKKTFAQVGDILELGLKIEINHWKRADEMRVARALKRLGWERTRKKVGTRVQWGYVKIAVEGEEPPPPSTEPPVELVMDLTTWDEAPYAGPTSPVGPTFFQETQFENGSKIRFSDAERVEIDPEVGPVTVEESPAPVSNVEASTMTLEEATEYVSERLPIQTDKLPRWKQKQVAGYAARYVMMGKSLSDAWDFAFGKIGIVFDDESY